MIALFHRLIDGEPHFYPIEGAEDEDWAAHAKCNPGTLKIEDTLGNVLWTPEMEAA